MPETRVASKTEIPSGEGLRVELPDGTAVALFHVEGQVYAIGDICSHELASLSDGTVEEDECQVECPKHGAQFDLKTGRPKTLPATRPVPTFTVRVDGDDIYVEHE